MTSEKIFGCPKEGRNRVVGFDTSGQGGEGVHRLCTDGVVDGFDLEGEAGCSTPELNSIDISPFGAFHDSLDLDRVSSGCTTGLLRKQSSCLSQQLHDSLSFERRLSQLPALSTKKGVTAHIISQLRASDSPNMQQGKLSPYRDIMTPDVDESRESSHDLCELAPTMPAATVILSNKGIKKRSRKVNQSLSPGSASSHAMPIPRLSRACTAPDQLEELSSVKARQLLDNMMEIEAIPKAEKNKREHVRPRDVPKGFYEDIAALQNPRDKVMDNIHATRQERYIHAIKKHEYII